MDINRKHIVAILVMSILLFIISVSIINKFDEISHRKPVTISYELYTVNSGDTLWSVAKQYYNGDPRKLIYEIEKANDISALITPGQELLIPILKE
jgi:LysM repeat protein